MTRLADPPIRQALEQWLRAGLHEGDRVVFEMPVCGGGARLDAARLNGRLEGYEIKSDRDTFARLPAQMTAYNRVVERMTLVCTPRHVVTALDTVPGWWGVHQATGTGDEVDLIEVRQTLDNPGREPVWVAQLLWKDECLALLEQGGIAGMTRQPRRVLWRRLAEEFDLVDLAAAVTAALKARDGWLAGG